VFRRALRPAPITTQSNVVARNAASTVASAPSAGAIRHAWTSNPSARMRSSPRPIA
jgi:hypothetical protein